MYVYFLQAVGEAITRLIKRLKNLIKILNKVFTKTRIEGPIITRGDLNDKICQGIKDRFEESFGLGSQNGRRNRLADLANIKKIIACNIQYSQQLKSTDNTVRNQIDYEIINEQFSNDFLMQ